MLDIDKRKAGAQAEELYDICDYQLNDQRPFPPQVSQNIICMCQRVW